MICTILGPKPSVVQGRRVILAINPKHTRLLKDPHRWSICLSKVEGNVVTVHVRISVHAPIGIWKCSLQTNIVGIRGQRYDYEVGYFNFKPVIIIIQNNFRFLTTFM